MKLLLTLITLITLHTTNSLAQQSRIRPMKCTSVALYAGGIIESNTAQSPNDFKLLAPQSVVLAESSIKRYSTSTRYRLTGDGALTGNAIASVMVAFKFGNKQHTDYKRNTLLRVGASYLSQTSLATSFFTKESSVYDTLVSIATGRAVFLDSVARRYYHMNYSSNQIRVDVAYLVRSDPYERWSLYTGIGLSGGISVNAKTQINYTLYNELETRYQNGTNYVTPINTVTSTETFNNRNNAILSAYVPLGIDVRLGNQKQFWTQTHLFYELRAAVNTTKIPELHTIINVSFLHGIGVRYSF